MLVLTAALRGPYDLLSVIGAVFASVTGGEPYFDAAPAWGATTAHLFVGLAAASAIAMAVIESRRARGACGWCGARPGAATCRPIRWAGTIAIVAAVAPIPYVLLKLGWSFGRDFGLVRSDAFDRVTFTTPGFGDTVVLALLAILAAVWMAAGRAGGYLRWVAVAVGAAGSAMLLPVGLAGVVLLGAAGLGLTTPAPGFLQTWVFILVYPTFAVWGASLAAATFLYWRRTRGVCPLRGGAEHRPHSTAPSLGRGRIPAGDNR